MDGERGRQRRGESQGACDSDHTQKPGTIRACSLSHPEPGCSLSLRPFWIGIMGLGRAEYPLNRFCISIIWLGLPSSLCRYYSVILKQFRHIQSI